MAPPSLSVHKNTREKRARRAVIEHLKQAIEEEVRTGDIAGYALVTWDKDGRDHARMFIGPDGPILYTFVADFTRGSIERRLVREEARSVAVEEIEERL